MLKCRYSLGVLILKKRNHSKIALCFIGLFLTSACTPALEEGLILHTFFNLENSLVNKEKAYIAGVENALNDFSDLADDVHYENITEVTAESVEKFSHDSPFFVNVGTFDQELQNTIKSKNLVPSIYSSAQININEYTANHEQFAGNPDLKKEAKAIGETLAENAFVIYSNDKVYETMYESFLSSYGEENLAGTLLLPVKSNAFGDMVDLLLSYEFDILLLFTSPYDFTNLMYNLLLSQCEKDVYLPSYAARQFVLPPNYMEAKFSTFTFAYNYHLLLAQEVLPVRSEQNYNERDFIYFLDGYATTHFVLVNYALSNSKEELINNLHSSYKTRNLSSGFIPFSSY